jgi:tetratricopeptide (TPR) repeat protein
MSARRLLTGSVAGAACALLVVGVAVAAPDDQDLSVQKLLERGSLEEALQRAERERDNPESTYLAAQAAAKMDNVARANDQYTHLREIGDDSWKAIGESGLKLLAGDMDGAMDAANRAVAANGDNAYAHFQLGIVASRQNNHERSLDAFARAIELKSDLAYAHYYAGLAAQRLRQTARMSQHFEAFMRLAPSAPERSAVAAILRTLRG